MFCGSVPKGATSPVYKGVFSKWGCREEVVVITDTGIWWVPATIVRETMVEGMGRTYFFCRIISFARAVLFMCSFHNRSIFERMV